MRGGKKKTGGETSADTAQEEQQPPPVADGSNGEGAEVDSMANHIVDDVASAAAETETSGTLVEQQMPEEGDEDDGSEEREEADEERDKGYDKFEDLQIDDGDSERPKLAEGFYEIEAVRKKRIRKGEAQYLIKWRNWPETANTWEPLENLQSCSDVIHAFEESLQAGKHRCSRRRKKSSIGSQTQPKRKQRTSPGAATYNVPAARVRIIEEPLPMAPLDNPSLSNEKKRYARGISNFETEQHTEENGFGTVSVHIEETREQNELNLNLSEQRGTVANNEVNVEKSAASLQESYGLQGDNPVNGVSKIDSIENGQPGRCTGSKRRKSGSVKRFTQASALLVPNDAQNAVKRINNGPNGRDGWQGNQNPISNGKELGHRVKYANSKSMSTITQIIKPISYQSSMINDVQDVTVTFTAMRSDGKEVMVDNKFLKANNPLLLINFYEQHIRYSPS